MFRVVYPNKSQSRPQPQSKKKKAPTIDLNNRLLVNTHELMLMLGCGRPSAIEIGTEAGARMMLGRKLMWNLAAVRKYLDNTAEAQRPVLLR